MAISSQPVRQGYAPAPNAGESRLKRLARWCLRLPRVTQVVARVLATSFAAVGAALLSAFAALSLNLDSPARWAVFAASTVGLVAVIAFAALLFSGALDSIRTEEAHRAQQEQLAIAHEDRVLATARGLADRSMLAEIEWLSHGAANATLVPADPLRLIRDVIQAAFDTLDTSFGEANRLRDRIEFEVSFMTKSYIDGGITIAASTNRHGRRPKSMIERPGNPGRYDKTVTAKVYADPRHMDRIVEDSHDEAWSDNYELYPGQRSSIRSAIVWPILSVDYQLLGTLVMHCDRPRFFLISDREFWRELCEIFAKRLAVAKLQLDRVAQRFGSGAACSEFGPPF